MGEKATLQKSEKLDYSRNFNALFDSDQILRLIAEHPEFILTYADHEQKEVLNFLGREFQVSPDCLYLGAGTTDLLFTLPRVLQRRNALISVPTFWEYQQANERAGVKVIKVPIERENNFSPDLSLIGSLADPNTVIYLCNPNNPTSHLIGHVKLQELIINNPKVAFVIDETYMLFREDYEAQSLVKLSTQVSNLYVVTSLSKFFSVPGLRIGMLSSQPDNICQYKKYSTPYLLSPIIDLVVPTLFADPNKNLEIRKKHTQLRKNFSAQLRKEFDGILEVFEPETNFVLVRILTHTTSTDLAKILHSQGILIRDGVEFEELGNNWIRISVKKEPENQRLIESMKAILY